MARGYKRSSGRDRVTIWRHAAAAAVVVFSFVYLYLLYTADSVNPWIRLAVGIVSMALIGALIGRLEMLGDSFGVYMIGGRYGIGTINYLAKRNSGLWKDMADWGIILGFGVFSYLILRDRTSKHVYALGFLTIIVMMLFVVPYTSIGLQFVKLPQLQALGYSGVPLLHMNLMQIVYEMVNLSVTIVFGLSGYIFYALLLGSFSVLQSVAAVIESVLRGAATTAPLSNQIPGVLPVIPGITIPLVSGIIAFIIILVIHEFSHGVLSVIAKVKIKKVGLLVFGVIPLGAFVEPDEKRIAKLDRTSQNRIYSAGVSANFIGMFVFFVLLMAMLPYINNNVIKVIVAGTTPGYPASNVIAAGSIIQYWNGHRITNLASLDSAAANDTPGKVVNVVTDRGSYSLVAERANGTSEGQIGVLLSETPILDRFWNGAAYFAYSVFAITLMLNFLIGAINLLPLPVLDGWRIYKTSTKRTWMINALTVLLVAALIIISLPWIGGLHP